ncbi:MAG: N-acetylmuramoyl-L-alanine amidase [Lachnospiraceae bacterium]|nr:N-acetylmuramoyl-L-alanine amidase [Lachnospiraceae bacterium]
MKTEMKLKTGCYRRKGMIFPVIFLLFVLLISTSALAATKLGWKQNGSKIYYYAVKEEGGTATAKVTGLRKIEGKYYYFDKKGIMQTGWVSMEDGFRYFRATGSLGVKGSMYTGFKTIGKYKFYFNRTNGIPVTGYKQLTKNAYYFSTKKELGVRGRSVLNTWANVKGKRYYFGSNGAMVKNAWVKNTYYVGEDGQKLINTVTPDGYLVGSDGKKTSNTKVKGWVKLDGKYHYYDSSKKKFLTSCWKTISGKKYYLNADGIRVTKWQNIGKYRYYFSSKGVMQLGWQTIGGKKYYFGSNGRMQVSTTVDGYVIDASGVAARPNGVKANILIIAGHGQGDSGATSSWGYESNFTRQFAGLIYDQLRSNSSVSVTYYKNGSTSYDCYQQNAKTFGSSGLNISSQITGAGLIRDKVISGLATNINLPSLSNYDYVLEVHFNATAASGKDPGGNGSYKGCGFYINSNKSKYTLEKNILSKIVALGFKQWGGGVYASSTLFNARICQELGVSYGLLETAFIDDGDDMRFYSANKTKMAKAVADAIISYYKD